MQRMEPRQCFECYVREDEREVDWDVHHVVWKSKGGGDEQKNLVDLCRPCHVELHYQEAE